MLTDQSVSHFYLPENTPTMAKSKPTPAGALSILEAATALFARDGYECVSVASIADQAGVCKANIFHHYASKEVLYLEVMRKASAEHAEATEALLKEDCSSVEKLQRLTEFDISTMMENEQRTRLILRELGEPGDTTVRRLAHQVFRRNFELVIELFKQGQQNGEFRADFDPIATGIAWCGSKNAFFTCRDMMQDQALFQEPGGPRAFAQKVCALLIEGILPASRAVSPVTHNSEPRAQKKIS